MKEREEALMRIVVGIISGIIIGVWAALIRVLAIFHFFFTVFTGERNKGLAEFCEIWNTQLYMYVRYMTFVTNKRPFPFTRLAKNISKYK